MFCLKKFDFSTVYAIISKNKFTFVGGTSVSVFSFFLLLFSYVIPVSKKIRHFINLFWGHKYIWAVAVFLVLVGFLSENSFWNRYKLYQSNQALRVEIKKYEDAYKRDSEELHALETNPHAVEHVARVHHSMKTVDEDVYIIEED